MNDGYILRGVALLFDRDSAHATPFRFGPASLQLHRPVSLNLDHLRVGVPFASTRDGTMQIWTTDKAVIFEAKLPATSINAGFVRLVETGGFDRVSIGVDAVTAETSNGRNLVSSAVLEEISITDAGGFEDTGIWVEDSQLQPSYHVKMAKVRYETAKIEIDRLTATARSRTRPAVRKRPVSAEFMAMCRAQVVQGKPAAWINARSR